ncbi:MAG TPA: hypothetical protein PLB81_05210 [Deltaproteobacteria bacterium]|nr:hypothetical protein [Deltaproteobacteria bacterium]
MAHLSEKTYRDIFFVGALWNLMVGLGNLTFFKTSMRIMFGKNAVTNAITSTLPLRFFYIAVALFGWGYYMVSRNLKENRGIIWMGMAAKVIIFGTFVWYYRLRQVKILAVLAGSVDFVFTILFAIFMWDTRRKEVRAIAG